MHFAAMLTIAVAALMIFPDVSDAQWRQRYWGYYGYGPYYYGYGYSPYYRNYSPYYYGYGSYYSPYYYGYTPYYRSYYYSYPGYWYGGAGYPISYNNSAGGNSGSAYVDPIALYEQANTQTRPATINVRVPDPTAQVWINGQLMQQQGLVRTYYTTEPLSAAGSNSYSIAVKWVQNGQPVEHVRDVRVMPGGYENVDFTTPIR
jgi:uncharacterized protein (TIGR03000 family)